MFFMLITVQNDFHTGKVAESMRNNRIFTLDNKLWHNYRNSNQFIKIMQGRIYFSACSEVATSLFQENHEKRRGEEIDSLGSLSHA